MPLKTGSRFRSQVCGAEVIVIRPGEGEVNLTCGGYPMVDSSEPPGEQVRVAEEGEGNGPQLGKRYTRAAEDIEILVTKGGKYPIAADGEELVVKTAKPLPASD